MQATPRICAEPVVVQARKTPFTLARLVAASMASPTKEKIGLVALAKGQARSEERWCVTFVKGVGSCMFRAFTVDLHDRRGGL